MSGFFEEMEISVPTVTERSKHNKEYTCQDCGLHKGCRSPKMEPTGQGRKKILIVAEAPGETEDKKNIQLIGEAGQVLREVLEELECDLDLDFWKTNACICRPQDNKTPTNIQISACRPNLFHCIENYNPNGIILMGATAFESLIGYNISSRIGKLKFGEWVGECIPHQEIKKWICPVYHPSFILRNSKDKALRLIWKNDLKRAIEICQQSVPVNDYNSLVSIIKDKNEAIKCIEAAMKWEAVAFDYETTGLKPHRKGHDIVYASVSNGKIAYAFPFFTDEEFRDQYKQLMMNDSIKIAHNIRFEELWTNVILNTKIRGKKWCTSIGQKCSDNRKNVKLKFHVFTKIGINDYSKDVDKFISSVKRGEHKKSNNSFNQIREADEDKTLLYNGLDSLYCFMLYEIQQTSIKKKKGFEFFMEGASALTQAQNNGICIHEKRMLKKEEKINEQLKEIDERINNSEEIKKWDRSKPFNFNSSDQLSHLLFDILKFKVDKKTKGEKNSTDSSVLEKIDDTFVKEIAEYKRWKKAKDTYIGQFKRELCEGKIHPFFNLDKVITFRSSSTAINFQNVPKHDKQVMNILRSLVIPSPGNMITEWDYKQLEVCVSACVHKDPNLIRYIKDEKSDMHRDQACELFLRKMEFYTLPIDKDSKILAKDERYIAKNKFVFREFYGGYFEQAAPEIWAAISEKTKDHLFEKGIRHLKDFIGHVEQVEKVFWNEKFQVFAEWKDRTTKEYNKKGYVDLLTGFRCYGPMKRNELVNYQIQGPAFHILLWLFIHQMKEINDHPNRYKYSKLIGQIHDASVGDVHPDEENYLDEFTLEYGTKKIREYWDWIIVPLRIEKESSDVDGTWADMESKGVLGE